VGTVIGGIDGRRRALVRVRRVGADDDFVAVVDTGFNGDLHMTVAVARALGFELRPEMDLVEVADGRRVSTVVGRGTIEWLGTERLVTVFASPDQPRSQQRGREEVVALLGTGLLSPHLLLLDFTAGTVEVEAQT
jgi:predicted aspartyl protease